MESDFKKILVPVDGSSFSKKAAAKAMRIGEKFGAKVIFVAVVSGEEVPAPGQFLGILKNDPKVEKVVHEMICTIRIEIQKILKEQYDKCKKRGIDADYEIIEGDPVKQIIKFAKKSKVDLILVGSHGLTGLGKLKALGSVSRGISELADCPVMIVR